MEKNSFKAKRYGYGRYPATKQGHLFLVLWMIFFTLGIIALVYTVVGSGNVWGALWIVPYSLVGTALLVWIGYKKGEPARWREQDQNDKK